MCFAPQRFVHFELKMRFVPQRRAIFGHQTFKNWSDPECFVHFDVQMCFTPQRRAIFPDRKWLRACGLLCILTWKCASRHSGVPFFQIENGSEHVAFCAFWLENALRATAACHFSFLCWTATSAPAALASLLFEHPEPRINEKTQQFATFLTFGACVSSF